MRYRILGNTQAQHPDGSPVALGGARLRALLTVLALRPGRATPVGVLVGEVWGDEPPADAPGALQALIGRLRRGLGHDAVFSAESGGYGLAAEADDIDLHRFERLTADGARALEDGDAAKAATLLDDALALWAGPALADLPDPGARAARAETRRLDARRLRLAAALALGRADETLAELAALCGTHPLDEPLNALRIRALRAAGRPAEALAAYESVRAVLADELGTDPGPELRAIHAELLNPVAEPAPPAPAPVPGNLRARLTSFVGRESELADIRGDLGSARLVTLLGPGGAGKTRLSQEVAEGAAERWPDGVWLAELAPLDDPAGVPAAVLTAVGARTTVLHSAGAEELRAADRHAGDPLVRLAEHCGPRRMLLLLDNCEHLIGAAAELAEYLLARCPQLVVLATSREPLGVPGELVRPVEPLAAPYALRLLAERGAAARPGFRVEDDPEAAAEICRRLDGLPLAIELAAARLRMLTTRQIADRLDDRFRLLTSGSRTVLPRQQTLRAVVDWSWELLEGSERAVLGRLAVFAGGCDLAAAEAVCAEDGPPGEAAAVAAHDVPEVLGSLVDKSLVVAAPDATGQMRYRLLETVAEYAGERLDTAGGRARAERRHLTYYRELARRTDGELRGPGQRAAIGLLEREYENLRTALRRSVALRDEQEALCLVHALLWYWQMRDLRAESRHWAQEAASLGPDPFAPPVTPAPPVYARCTDAPPPMAPDVLEEARRGVQLVQLASMDHDADVWSSPDALRRIRSIAGAYRPGLPQTCRMPGSLWFFPVVLTGDQELLQRVLDETVRACEELGYEWELAAAHQMRANVLANRTAWSGDAAGDADASLAMFRRLGDAWGAAEALAARGEAREKRGEFALAAEDFAAALQYAEQLDAHAQVMLLRARLAGVLLETGEEERGEAMLREILADDRRSGVEARLAARLVLSVWLGRTRRFDEAREQVEVMLRDLTSATLMLFQGFVLGVRAWIANEQGRYDDALSDALAALDRSDEPLARMVAPEMLSIQLLSAAWALAGSGGTGNGMDAARLIGAHDALLPDGHFSAPVEAEQRASAERATRAVLDDAAYATGYAEGGGLRAEEATALVRRDRMK
ncbi:BTAD domain-containing putative transcriptional regulator [Streptomyces sp. NBC_00083]|uniref:BTAD domain-containing putative transcriptional regulator n=1 Tax=Streptomyces sp. NBC_00083 TaxID=2975647 RepID=UPI00224D76DE|nr:BTAD domain-containing putative transcriptional regulator [Streptomyces sp. NBC_00083]MCX5382788.1 AfsR family transcriptional regulator [Streptomyces sp. NBC_00083]